MSIFWQLITDCQFPKKCENIDMLCCPFLPVAEATASGLKGLIGVSVKVSGLEGPRRQQLRMNSTAVWVVL